MRRALCVVGVLFFTVPATASMQFWPFGTDAERLIDEARLARQRLDFATAANLLDDAATQDPHMEARVLLERGLIARDRGDLESGLGLLKRAGDKDGQLSARVDQAGVLVQLGRWPEAVEVLRQAFDERGTSLTVDEVTSDKRFVKLGTLKPYQEVIDAARTEQSGPFGRVLIRLERLQSSANTAEYGLQRLAIWLGFLRELVTEPATLVALLVFFGLFLTFGINQLGLFRAPWNIVAGMGIASILWSFGAHAVTSGQSFAPAIVGAALSVVGSVWALGFGVRLAWRRYQIAQMGAGDPFAPEHLADTLVLVDEVSRLGHRVVGLRKRDQRVLAEALRAAGETLRERLEKGAGGT